MREREIKVQDIGSINIYNMSPKIKYHKKEKILSLRLSKEKSADSDIKGNMVIDYDAKGEVVNVDIMSINLSDFVPTRQLSSLAIKVAV